MVDVTVPLPGNFEFMPVTVSPARGGLDHVVEFDQAHVRRSSQATAHKEMHVLQCTVQLVSHSEGRKRFLRSFWRPLSVLTTRQASSGARPVPQSGSPFEFAAG